MITAPKRYSVETKLNRVNKFDEQWYTVLTPEGERDIVSVTTYLDALPKGIGFYEWVKKHPEDAEKIRNEAGQRGSIVHDIIQRTLRGETVSFANDDGTENFDLLTWERYLAWCRWFKEAELEPLYVEQIVYDFDARTEDGVDVSCAGTVDLVARRKKTNEVGIVDYKTGAYVGDSAEIQVSRYGDLVLKNKLLERLDFLEVVQFHPSLNKKGYRVKPIEPKKEYLQNLEDFDRVAAIWRRLNPNARPKYKVYPNAVSLEWIAENPAVGTLGEEEKEKKVKQ